MTLWLSLVDTSGPVPDAIESGRSSPRYEIVGAGPRYLRFDDPGPDRTTEAFSRAETYEAREIDQKNCDPGRAAWTDFLYLVFFQLPEPEFGELNAWYDQEHTPMLMKAPGWEGCRRFRLDGGRFNTVAVHHLSALSAMESSERAAARATEWTARLRATKPWFGTSLHTVYQKRVRS